MIIGIDGNEANVEKKVGIGVYAFELLQQFEKFHPPTGRIKFQIYLKNKPNDTLPKEREGWHYRVVQPKPLWTQIGLPFDLYRHKSRPEVFFSPTHYAPRFSPIPTAISIMDLSYLYYPNLFRRSDLYQLQHWTAYSAKEAKVIFTISNASKNDIIKAYTVEPDKVVVTYPGIKIHATAMNTKESDIVEKYGLREKYILFVGTLQPRKNIVRLIEAFSKLVKEEKMQNITLVIIGKKGWLYEDILAAPQRFGVREKVKFFHDVEDTELPSFYKNATFFILPSLYEGFGLPVLEAMHYGCPVITSNVSSLPEAGGDAALYIDPQSVEDIAKKMHELMTNTTLRENMVKKGHMHLKKFNWETTAQQTLDVLTTITKQ